MKSQIKIIGTKPPIIKNNSNIGIEIFGDLVGSIHNGDLLSHDESIERLANSRSFEEVEDFLFIAIGSFFCKVSINSVSRVYCSLVHSSLYYLNTSTNLFISEEEKRLISSNSVVRTHGINRIGSAHHGLARFPLNSLFSDIARCPAGAYIEIGESEEKTKVVNYLSRFFGNQGLGPSGALSKEFFEERLRLIMTSYINYYGELSLFMSGGVDSSVLLAIAVKNKLKVKCYYIPYNGLDDNNYKIAKFITSYLGMNLYVVDKDSLDESELKEAMILRAKSGPAALLKHSYIDWYLKKDIAPRVGITGQNLDSMYHIDTFAPNTEYTGIYRFLVLLKSSIYRIKYTAINVVWVNLLCKVFKYENVIDDMFNNILNSDEEHVKKRQPPTGSLYQSAKVLETKAFKKFINLPKLQTLTNEDQNKFFKLIKFFRFVQNTYSNYFVLRKSENLTRLNPYGEGPFIYGLMNYILPIKSIFQIKLISHKVFKDIAGSHHNKLVKKSVGYTVLSDVRRVLNYFIAKHKTKNYRNSKKNFLEEAKKVLEFLGQEIDFELLKLQKEDADYTRSIIKKISSENFISEKEYDEVLKVLGTLVYLTSCYEADESVSGSVT